MVAEAARDSLYLVDAHSLIFQVFHALPMMSSPSGLPTNAVYGFTKDMLLLRRERKPTHLVCVFDVGERTFRDNLAADYKANRAPMPDDLKLQLPLIRQVLEAMRIPVLGVAGVEADDVIATLAQQGAARGMEVYLCTSDKDFRQLITDDVKMFNLRKMSVGDLCLYYHTGDEKAVVGVAKVTKAAYADPTTDEDWSVVDVAPLRAFAEPVPLATLKANAKTKDMVMVRRPRISVTPVTPAELSAILALGKTKLP